MTDDRPNAEAVERFVEEFAKVVKFVQSGWKSKEEKLQWRLAEKELRSILKRIKQELTK